VPLKVVGRTRADFAALQLQPGLELLGDVPDARLPELFSGALALLYPSQYEGFGLPVLEAMSYGTPVVSFENAATKEVAGNQPDYVHNVLELADALKKHLHSDAVDAQEEKLQNIAQAKKWSWTNTSRAILSNITGQ